MTKACQERAKRSANYANLKIEKVKRKKSREKVVVLVILLFDEMERERRNKKRLKMLENKKLNSINVCTQRYIYSVFETGIQLPDKAIAPWR